MKRSLALLLSAGLWVGALSACGGPSAQESPDSSGAQLTGTVVTNGSTSMEKVMGALIEGFQEVQPGITVTYEPTGSGSGVEAASNGSADIGLASRGLKEEEKEGLTETVAAKDGIAIVVDPANGVEDLTSQQIADIAAGRYINWKELGGADESVVFIGREAGSGTRGAFEELTGTGDACVYAQELTSTGAVMAAVASTPGAIGYVSLSSVNDSVKVVKVDGVLPSEETVLDGSYPIQRPLVFATRTGEALSPAAQAFFDFALSREAGALYTLAGVVPASR